MREWRAQSFKYLCIRNISSQARARLALCCPFRTRLVLFRFFYQHNRDCMIKKTDEAGEEDSRCLIRNIKNMLESSWRNSSLCSCEREFYYMFLFGEINESTLSFLPTVWFHFNLVHTINANSKYYSHTGQVSLSVSTLSHYGALKYIKFNKIIALWERDWIFLVTRKYSLLEIDTFLLD